MAQVMPSEIGNLCAFQCRLERLGVCPSDTSSLIRKHPARMLLFLPAQNEDRLARKRQVESRAILRLASFHPHHPPFEVHPRPLKTRHVRFPKPCRETETNEFCKGLGPLRLRQLPDQPFGFLRRDPANADYGFVEKLKRG